MGTLDYLVILAYFIGLIAVSVIMSRKIRSSEDMFLAGRNSSWWLSGISSYMTIFSASTFVVWGGVAYKSGLVAIVVANCLGLHRRKMDFREMEKPEDQVARRISDSTFRTWNSKFLYDLRHRCQGCAHRCRPLRRRGRHVHPDKGSGREFTGLDRNAR